MFQMENLLNKSWICFWELLLLVKFLSEFCFLVVILSEEFFLDKQKVIFNFEDLIRL